MPSRRFHEDGRETSKLATGRGARTYPPGAPAVAKQTRPGDPLQVHVEPVVHDGNIEEAFYDDRGPPRFFLDSSPEEVRTSPEIDFIYE